MHRSLPSISISIRNISFESLRLAASITEPFIILRCQRELRNTIFVIAYRIIAHYFYFDAQKVTHFVNVNDEVSLRFRRSICYDQDKINGMPSHTQLNRTAATQLNVCFHIIIINRQTDK